VIEHKNQNIKEMKKTVMAEQPVFSSSVSECLYFISVDTCIVIEIINHYLNRKVDTTSRIYSKGIFFAKMLEASKVKRIYYEFSKPSSLL